MIGPICNTYLYALKYASKQVLLNSPQSSCNFYIFNLICFLSCTTFFLGVTIYLSSSPILFFRIVSHCWHLFLLTFMTCTLISTIFFQEFCVLLYNFTLVYHQLYHYFLREFLLQFSYFHFITLVLFSYCLSLRLIFISLLRILIYLIYFRQLHAVSLCLVFMCVLNTRSFVRC